MLQHGPIPEQQKARKFDHGIASILQLPGFWPDSTSYHHTSPSSWYLFVSPGAREPNTSRGVDACIQARMLVFQLMIYPNYCDFRHCACLTRLPSRLHCTLPPDNKVLPCSTAEESTLQHGPIPEQQPFDHGIASILQLPGFRPACGHSTSYHHISPSSWYMFVSPGAREPNTSRGVDACNQARMLIF